MRINVLYLTLIALAAASVVQARDLIIQNKSAYPQTVTLESQAGTGHVLIEGSSESRFDVNQDGMKSIRTGEAPYKYKRQDTGKIIKILVLNQDGSSRPIYQSPQEF